MKQSLDREENILAGKRKLAFASRDGALGNVAHDSNVELLLRPPARECKALKG
jgi:hypothetical protein